jgi:hypothetical protein
MSDIKSPTSVLRRDRALVRLAKRLLQSARRIEKAHTDLQDGPKLSKAEARHRRHLRIKSALWKAAAEMRQFTRSYPETELQLDAFDELQSDSLKAEAFERSVRAFLPRKGSSVLKLAKSIGAKGIAKATGASTWEDLLSAIDLWQVRAMTFAMKADGDFSDMTVTVCAPDGSMSPPGERCAEVPAEDILLLAIFAAIVAAIIAIIYGIGKLFEELLTDDRDDRSRELIASMDCTAIVAVSNGTWINVFRTMIDGPTLDGDEKAMLKVLGCLPSDRVFAIVTHFGLGDFLDEFQGAEFDRLVILLQGAGMLSFSDWDDDATRRFINGTPESTLAELSLDDITQLCRNLFSGSCGDDDERAILRLIRSQDLCKVKRLLLERISSSTFDDHVDGSEWTRLSRFLREAERAVC